MAPRTRQMKLKMRAGRTALLAVVTVVGLAGCSPTVDVRGFVPNALALKQIKPGVDNRESVRRMLGTPTSTDPFRDTTWLYISRRTQTVAFYQPLLLEQSVVAVDFDPKGIVAKVDQYDMKDGKRVDIVARETPTRGRELTVLGQMFSNLGRFNSKGSSQLPTNTSGGRGGSGRP